jgi:hypothetical protein
MQHIMTEVRGGGLTRFQELQKAGISLNSQADAENLIIKAISNGSWSQQINKGNYIFKITENNKSLKIIFSPDGKFITISF